MNTPANSQSAPVLQPGYGTSRYLRWAGVAALVVAIADFLLQGVHLSAQAWRDWAIPGMALVLAGFGLICGYAWKETRGARTFFGLATALLPIQAAQLGAQIYDRMHGPGDSLLTLGIKLLAASALFMPITHTGFRILARPYAARLQVLMMAGSISLMLPWRDAAVTTMLLAALTAGLVFAGKSWLGQAATLEQRIARALIWIAPLIVSGRAFYYPDAGLPLSAALVIGSLYISHFDVRVLGISTRLWGLIGAALAWTNMVAELSVMGVLPDSLYLCATGLPICLRVLTYRPEESNDVLRIAAASSASIIALITLWNYPGHDFALLSLLVGTTVAMFGHRLRSRTIFAIGLGGAVLSLGYYLHYAVDLYRSSSWLSLAILGVVAMLAASYMERTEKPMLERVLRWVRPEEGWRMVR